MSEDRLDAARPRLLVVDDYENIRSFLSMLLTLEGFQVEACADGPSALHSISTNPPDLVLLDVAMPGMTGFQVLEAIRRQWSCEELPVIMLTAMSEPDDVVFGLQSGANDYLTKPVGDAELCARVWTQLRLTELQAQRRRDLERLQELDTLKDRFVMITSHELRGPLSTIFTATQLIREMIRADAADMVAMLRVVDAVEAASSSMESIISDFLDLQAIKAGGLELNPRSVRVEGLIDRSLEQLRYNAERKGIGLRVESDGRAPECMADATRLIQVICNLVGNAIKYSPPGAEVVVRSQARDGWVRVEVQDSGPGIPDEELPHVFEEFARLRNRPTGGEPSSGVGLSITRELVHLHGGRIGADSRAGSGSLFWFELPRVVTAPVEN